MKRILLATNLGPSSCHALERALLVAKSHTASLHVLHVAPLENEEAPDTLARQVEAAIERLQRNLEDEFGAGFAPESAKSLTGDPVLAIAAEAKSVEADLLIAGLSESADARASIDGTILKQLLIECDAPIVVVKSQPSRGYEKVLVGLDLSPTSHRALETALQVAPTAHFAIVHASERQGDDDLRAKINRIVRGCVSITRTAMGLHQGAIDIYLETGDVADVIARHANQLAPDLVVFGRHNRGAANGPYLGSGARGIIEALDADMLVTVSTE